MNLKRQRILFLLACLVIVCLGHVVYAQAPVAVPNAPVQVPIGGGSSVIVRPLWTEIFITVIMFGLALFAVGRSSNRS